MRRTLSTLILTLALTPMVGAEASRPGVTPTSKCVSGYEFENLRVGTPRAEAEEFLDGPGRGWSSLRVYRSCAGPWRQAQVGVKYKEGRVRAVFGVRIDNGRLDMPPR